LEHVFVLIFGSGPQYGRVYGRIALRTPAASIKVPDEILILNARGLGFVPIPKYLNPGKQVHEPALRTLLVAYRRSKVDPAMQFSLSILLKRRVSMS
jgi:hypothetical protein